MSNSNKIEEHLVSAKQQLELARTQEFSPLALSVKRKIDNFVDEIDYMLAHLRRLQELRETYKAAQTE